MRNKCRTGCRSTLGSGGVMPCPLLATLALGIALYAVPAHAQFGVRPNTSGPTTAPAAATGGALDLPKGITKIISIDAQNSLLVEVTDPDDLTNHQYLLIPIQHVYSYGIAKVFGGGNLPTAMFVSPASQGGGAINGAGGNRAQPANSGSPSGGAVTQFSPGNGATSGATAPLGAPAGIAQIVGSMQLTPKPTIK